MLLFGGMVYPALLSRVRSSRLFTSENQVVEEKVKELISRMTGQDFEINK